MKNFKSSEPSDNAMELLSIARDGIESLVSGYKKLPQKGIYEVTLFNTIFVLNSKCLLNSTQRFDIEDEYFSILSYIINEEMPNVPQEYMISFINGRLSFYMEEYKKLINDRLYTAMFIYYNFYINPLHNDNSQIETPPNPMDLLSFTKALYNMINWVQKQIN